jgi:DNA-binding transcriptional LysR family regulator
MNRAVKPSSLDLNLLVVFDAIVKDRNVTKAARRVGLSQPAMSSALNRLRLIFKDPLFVRTGDGMVPTPFAQQLSPPIQRACELIENLGDIGAAFDPRSAAQTFRFYMTDIGETIFLPRLLRALDQRAPQVTVQVLTIPEYGEQAAMAAGEVDLAVGFFPDLKSGFFQQRLYQDEFVCLVRADHPLAHGALSVRQFASMRHAIVASAGTGHEAAISRALGRHRLKVALHIPHFMAVPAIISQTDYVVTVPTRFARALEGFPGLRAIQPPVKIPAFEIKQHWHERYHRDPANRWIRALVAELFLE